MSRRAPKLALPDNQGDVTAGERLSFVRGSGGIGGRGYGTSAGPETGVLVRDQGSAGAEALFSCSSTLLDASSLGRRQRFYPFAGAWWIAFDDGTERVSVTPGIWATLQRADSAGWSVR